MIFGIFGLIALLIGAFISDTNTILFAIGVIIFDIVLEISVLTDNVRSILTNINVWAEAIIKQLGEKTDGKKKT